MAIGTPIPQHAMQPRSPLSLLDVCIKVDTATVFTTGGYHMSRAKPGGMISAFVWASTTWRDSRKYCTPVSLGEPCCWPSVLAWA